mmetsp:Transcript_62273/g.197167  ORF Transcript_62273/g.197167 Transcript_62273/m.197167 type:complete len:308 (+) Transcript_62273:3087-4010(+)
MVSRVPLFHLAVLRACDAPPAPVDDRDRVDGPGVRARQRGNAVHVPLQAVRLAGRGSRQVHMVKAYNNNNLSTTSCKDIIAGALPFPRPLYIAVRGRVRREVLLALHLREAREGAVLRKREVVVHAHLHRGHPVAERHDADPPELPALVVGDDCVEEVVHRHLGRGQDLDLVLVEHVHEGHEAVRGRAVSRLEERHARQRDRVVLGREGDVVRRRQGLLAQLSEAEVARDGATVRVGHRQGAPHHDLDAGRVGHGAARDLPQDALKLRLSVGAGEVHPGLVLPGLPVVRLRPDVVDHAPLLERGDEG